MEKKVGFGIIGAGAISAKHAQAIKSLDNVELVGFYDPVVPAVQGQAGHALCIPTQEMHRAGQCRDF